MIEIILSCLIGTVYGLIIGLIPAAGATTGLVGLFGAMSFFLFEPYLGVVFLMAVVGASTTCDTYSSILLGIPGANSSAATMVDGHPLALQGKANYALTAAIITSTLNGLIWGMAVFLFFPYYGQLILWLGIPEMWALVIMALVTVGFISNNFWFRSCCAIIIGLFLGSIGIDPITGLDRLTFGWEYLADGIQIIPIVAGLFAIPELLEMFRQTKKSVIIPNENQTLNGIIAVWKYRWTALRGGIIGAIIGLLPGLGGAISDWLSYGATVALNPKEKFGEGNIKGVIGPEGSNNAQKATSMIPTVLFGIPGASFAAILLGLFAFLGFELGTTELILNTQFFHSMSIGFLGSTILIAIFCLICNKYISRLLLIPFKYYCPVILTFIIWSCLMYTGGIADIIMLIICSILGIIMKKYYFSRPALLLAYILAPKLESLSIQMIALYNIDMLLGRPIFIILCLLSLIMFIGSILKKNRISYT